MEIKEFIKDWFEKYGISAFSLYVCTLLILHNTGKEYISENINSVVSVILTQLTSNKKITTEQNKLYSLEISNNYKIWSHFKNIIIDLIGNNPLSEKDDESYKNCFPCRKYKNRK